MKYILTLLLLINTFLFSSDIEIKMLKKNLHNAQTALVTLKASGIKQPKLSLDKLNINFYKNHFKKDSYYALVPLSYYIKTKKHKIIISYIRNNTKYFKGVTFNVTQGSYKSETINVPSSKVTLSKKDKKRTKIEYAHAMKIYNTTSKKLLWNKDFIYPMESRITSPFGTKRLYNKALKSYHSGTDYKAAVGEEIHAVNDGIAKIVQNRFYAGGSVVIDHGHGVYSCYFHLSKFKINVGDRVKQGDLIGLSGETGRVTGPHLHFSFKVHGITVDPLQTIRVLNTLNN